MMVMALSLQSDISEVVKMHNPGMYVCMVYIHYVCMYMYLCVLFKVLRALDMIHGPCVPTLAMCTASEEAVPSFEAISAGTPRSRKRYHGVKYAFLLTYTTTYHIQPVLHET